MYVTDNFLIICFLFSVNVVYGQLPQWQQTWAMNQSTIMMVCNDTGFVRPDVTAKWTIVDVSRDNSEKLLSNDFFL